MAVNLIGARSSSVDMTEKKVYTLSQASKDLVGALPDYFTVKAYISEDYRLNSYRSAAFATLDEYQTPAKASSMRPSTPRPTKLEMKPRNATSAEQIQVLNNTKIEMACITSVCAYSTEINQSHTCRRPTGRSRIPNVFDYQEDDPTEVENAITQAMESD